MTSPLRGAFALAAVVALVAGSSATASAGSGAVEITGAVRQPTTLTLQGLATYPVRTESVTFESSGGRQSHAYRGATLFDVVSAADPDVDPARKHPMLTLTVLATGADGYRAAIAWGEIAPDLAATPVLVADTEDGEPLDQPRLVVPGDVEGARYVSDLVELRVVDLAAP